MVFLPLRVLFLLSLCQALNVALFPSSGCYSHDVMMKQVGEEFSSKDNITWIQTHLYDFGFGEIPLADNWNRISISGHDEPGQELMSAAGKLIWQQNVPTDFERLWDFRGSIHFIKILERHQEYCEKLLLDQRFTDFMKSGTSEIVVLDHFLQECIGGLTHLLNASVIQFSNWPIADGYITSLNIPANPSSIPKTGTPFSGLGMSFFDRVMNFLFHSIINFARILQVFILNNLFARHGYPRVNILQTEADRVIYAGRSEFLMDVVRPINNRIKHFGGAQLEPKDYVVALPSSEIFEIPLPQNNKIYLDGELVMGNDTRPVLACCQEECKNKSKRHQYRSQLYKNLSTVQVEEKFVAIQQKYPEIDWERLNKNSFILVSFGSVAKVENMDASLLQLLVINYGRSKHDIIWQTNSKIDSILSKNNITLPENTKSISWAPIKELLAHPNLQYIICHGGINTVNELLLFGVPVLGVPLQGDQSSNLRRLADLGAAEIVTTVGLRSGGLEGAMKQMESNLDRYWRRSNKLSSMVQQYRSLHHNDQKFWLNWTARNGKKLKGRNIMKMKYTGYEENLFWMQMLSLIGALLAISVT